MPLAAKGLLVRRERLAILVRLEHWVGRVQLVELAQLGTPVQLG